MSTSKNINIAMATAALSLLGFSLHVVPSAVAASGQPSSFWTIQVASSRLVEGAIHAVQPGMNEAHVLTLAGQPNAKSRPRHGAESWDYTFLDTWGHPSVFSVVFDGGVVTSKASTRVRY